MYQAALTLLRKAWHGHALFWGRNETQASTRRSCIVLAPHPDDESIGMGATIARKTDSGTRVVLVVATDGRYSQHSQLIETEKLIALRKEELNCAAEILGIKENDIFFVDEIDTKIDADRLKKRCEEIIDSLDCDIEEILSTSWNDSHHDHKVCAKIAREIARERGLIFRGCPIYWWADGPTRFHRGHNSAMKRFFGRFLDIKRAFLSRGYTVDSENYSDTRTQAISAYKSQITQLNGDKNWTTLDERWLSTFHRSKEFFIDQ